jgi:integrase
MGNSEYGIRLLDSKGNFISLEDLSQDRLKKLVTAVSETRKNKYERRRGKKYGGLNKGFTDEELERFFKFCSNPKAFLAFFLMANLGLRVGEVVKIKLSDLDFKIYYENNRDPIILLRK